MIDELVILSDLEWKKEFSTIENYCNIYGDKSTHYDEYCSKLVGDNIEYIPQHNEYYNLFKKATLWNYGKQFQQNSFTKIFQYKNVLDVGMGQGPFAVFYINHGATSYTGVDPSILLDGSKIRDFRLGCGRMKNDINMNSLTKEEKNDLDKVEDGGAWYHDFGYTPKQIMDILPNVKLIPNILENCVNQIDLNSKDVVLLNCVSEHLDQLPRVIEYCYKFTKKGGKLYLTHGNYYSWAGHHQTPRIPLRYDPNNKKHNIYIDWKHLSPKNPAYHNPTLNRVRLLELKKLIEKYYIIEYWYEAIDVNTLNRLTSNIRHKWSEYTLSELLTNVPVIIAKKRNIPLDYTINQSQYFHPNQLIEKSIYQYIIDPKLEYKELLIKLYRKEYIDLLFNECELTITVKLINSEIDINKVKSMGIHLLLTESLLMSNKIYILSFEAKANNYISIGKNLKIYTGNKWIILDNELKNYYQNYSVKEEFNFKTKSKYRIGLQNAENDISISLKNFKFTKYE